MVDTGDAPVPARSYGRTMTTTTDTQPLLDRATAERLAAGFNRCFETFEADPHTVAEDVFFDLFPPLWRFQIQGRDAIVEQLRAIADGEVTVRLLRLSPTDTGFVMEHEETSRGAEVMVARRLIRCEVRDGVIVEASVFCNGGWDDALRARHAAEAPMLRADG
jgi:hypothetical protein